jgi:hypothetical protein
VRQRGQHAGAVARVRLAAAGAAVVHVLQHDLGIADDLMTPLALDVGHEPDAAALDQLVDPFGMLILELNIGFRIRAEELLHVPIHVAQTNGIDRRHRHSTG